MTMSLQGSPVLRRFLALAILAGFIGVLLFGVALPTYSSYVDARSAVEQLRAALSRIGANDADVAKLKTEAAQLRAAKTIGLMQSANDSLAAADLQNRIKSLAESVHADLQSTQILGTRTDGNFRRVSIRSQISVDLAGLQKIFYSLESSSPLLFLDNIDIRVRPGRKPGGADDVPLDVSFDVYGYL